MSTPPSPLRAVAVWLPIALTAPFYLTAAILAWPIAPAFSYKLNLAWVRRSLDAMGVTVSIHPRGDTYDPGRACLYVSLHQTSLLDAFVVPLLGPRVRYILNARFAWIPFVGWSAWAMGGVVLNRLSQKQTRRAMRAVETGMKRGECFGVSIEGRRSERGELSTYKKGPAVVAISAQADIVPFIIRGGGSIWPYGDWKLRPGVVEVDFLARIPTTGLTYADRDALTARLRALALDALGHDEERSAGN